MVNGLFSLHLDLITSPSPAAVTKMVFDAASTRSPMRLLEPDQSAVIVNMVSRGNQMFFDEH